LSVGDLSEKKRGLSPGSMVKGSSAGPAGRLPYVDRGGSLPSFYGKTCLAILPRDPGWGYAYWEITKRDKETLPKGKPLLRIYRLDARSARRFSSSIKVDLGSGNWYFRVERDDSSYVAELGIMTGSGRFFLIARSNVIHIPRGRVCDRDDQDWCVIRSEFNGMIERAGLNGHSLGSHTVSRMILERMKEMIRENEES